MLVAQYCCNTFSVERVETWKNIKLTVKYCCVTDITTLRGIDGDVFVALVALLIAQLLGIMRVLLDFVPQSSDLLLIVLQTSTQMLFHFFYFRFFRKLLQQVLNL